MKNSSNRRRAELGAEDVGSKPSHTRVEYYLEELLLKKSLKREKALALIVDCLTSNFILEREFLKTNFATFLYRCLNLLKRGSAKELHSASQAIGLLAMIVADEDNEQEIYIELLPVLSEALKTGPKTLKVFECLAIVTFFCASNSAETERAMGIIWEFIHSDSNANARKRSPDVLVAAISAWSFLVSSLDGWRFNAKFWQGAVSYLLHLLEDDDPSVYIAAGQGLALIFESRNLDKFCSREKSYGESSTLKMYSCVEETIKGVVLEKLEHLGRKQISETVVDKVKKQYLHILEYFQSGCCSKIAEPIRRDILLLSSWSQIIQLNYVKSFLGNLGFCVHMEGNGKLQDVFELRPTGTCMPVEKLYVPTVKEVSVSYFLPKERDLSHLTKEESKKERLMRFCLLDKARTQLMNKNRNLAVERKQMWSD